MDIQYKEINSFGWRVKKWHNKSLVKTCLIKRKSALRNRIRLRIVRINMDKNMGAADADKTDVIIKYVLQLWYI